MPNHRVFKDSQSIRAVLRRQEDEQRRQRSTSPFSGTGMQPNGLGGLDSDIYAAGVSGFRFTGTGDAEFNSLVLREGSVPTSAVSNPNVPGVAGTQATNFALSTTAAEVAGLDLTVPTNCTQLLIVATGNVYAENPGAADALWAFVKVATTASTALGTPLAAGSLATASASMATSLAGLTPLSTVRLGVWASTSVGSIAANANHVAIVSASLVWKP